MLKLTDFDYLLPKELIAQYPLEQRDSARLLVLNRAKSTIEHCVFKDIIDYFNKNDLLVLNNTKVLPSRLIGSRKTGGKVEILLLNRNKGFSFNALIRPSRVKINEKIIFNGNGISCEVSASNQVTFLVKDIAEIYALGKTPLPPYIKREPIDLDAIYYQTVYAKAQGSIASPTAGLHFSEELLKEIKAKGINLGYVTLHIGYSTFAPVKSEDITQHKMQKEVFSISSQTQELLEVAQLKKGRIIAVGTTSLRAIETFSQTGETQGTTDLFIYPGYNFKIADCLLTNFHLPRTTLFMLAAAFATDRLIKKAYQEAIEKKYRFYSYGDAMLII
ncbi:MAG: tRNA preQ1(34) S-adenosylmethionine ribosyltransferase-isomerase QueA [Omnitrophica WOR_2 bacterium RBG_13_41_10]|nr:MAG: tRNA preQ1(34) S-adenosylmethionine ribosyltransferase-isomerase QueA [Omnitrophica WOR_2 bacterium RBG_13_41_10]